MENTKSKETYKEFLQLLRKLELANEYNIHLLDEPSTKLAEYIHMLGDVKFEEAFFYRYYGDISKILNSFMTYWDNTLDVLIKENDRIKHNLNRETLILMVDRTIKNQQIRQETFCKSYLPVDSQTEKDKYNEVESIYSIYRDKMLDLRATVEKFDKPNKVADFADKHFETSMTERTEAFKFTHTFLSLMLADRVYQIKTSITEILQRVSNNLQDMHEKSENYLNSLLNKIYNKNKEHLKMTRNTRKSSIDVADVEKSIQNIRIGMEAYKKDVVLHVLEDEVKYWKRRNEEFDAIANVLNKLKAEQEDIDKQEKIYNSTKCYELPGRKRTCWENIGKNIRDRKEYLKSKILEAAKPLVSFFAIKGLDSIYFTDDIGKYYIDDQGHKVYVFDYGLHVYHVDDCGNFINYDVTEKHYYDEYGRYTKNENGEKTYKLAACGSCYKIEDENILIKMQKDSEDAKQTKSANLKEKSYNIKQTLSKDDVAFLWESFGYILPEALRDVATTQPKNPTHFLAHRLLFYKYHKTSDTKNEKKQEAATYFANIYKKREDLAKAQSLAWKAKQVKRRKPEESDDTYNAAVYDAHVAQQLFIQSLQL